jgi:hypothetical protein
MRWKFARNLVAACVGAVLVSWSLHTFGPVETSTSLDMERVARERETCEILFVGPSYVVSQVHPGVFDSEAAKRGYNVRSCKFGDTGMRGVELWVHMKRVLDLGWPRLSLVVVDITLGGMSRFDEVNWYTPRLIQWHTWESVGFLLGQYRKEGWDDVTAKKLAAHAGHLAANYLNLGTGIEKFAALGIVARALNAFGAKLEIPVSEVEREYVKDMAAQEERKKNQAKEYQAENPPEVHRQRVETLIAEKRRVLGEESIDDDWPLAVRNTVRKYGADAYFIQAPVWRPQPAVMEQPSSGDPLVFFDFNDPELYPALYTPKNRGANHHVSWYGGIAYSKLLAKKICKEKMKQEKKPQEGDHG